ncbi:MAG TPA: T9SS type A sorting domain-containing protein [Saprospiraceae bacterium]|nr:T9SS type A sorting domain-containing protein [Saprospiraceae bacterium]HQW94734.1 T9SS type A sorting domain-containing protein [Saprospiraceae bacterium]
MTKKGFVRNFYFDIMDLEPQDFTNFFTFESTYYQEMRIFIQIFFSLSLLTTVNGQNYTVYHTGSNRDTITVSEGGICMMGGSTEDDNAMRWFLQRAGGGDILVLRTSGSNGYNSYMYSKLGVKVNSVETIVCHTAAASNEAYIHEKIQGAEAIWFAGGDQGEYVRYWQNTKIDSLINVGIRNRNIVLGGTSAGMAIMGKFIYTGRNGSVTSEQALTNPYHSRVTIDTARFLDNRYLEEVITDTHYDDPDRRGRHVTFLARILTDFQVEGKGIACDEYTAVCIDEDGVARVFGEYPSSNDNAYFLRPNCGLTDNTPELCQKNQPLTWSRQNRALWVYRIKGTKGGENTFDLKDWVTGNGGNWEYWYVNNGTLGTSGTDQADCSPLSTYDKDVFQVRVFPDPAVDVVNIQLEGEMISDISLMDMTGNVLLAQEVMASSHSLKVDNLIKGTYILHIQTNRRIYIQKFVKL